MNAKRTYYLLIGLTVVILMATVGVLYLASSLLSKNSQKLVEYKAENAGIEQSKKIYNKAAIDLKKYQPLKAAVDEALPKEKDQAKAVKEIYQIASETGIQIEEIKFTDSTLGQKAKPTTTTPTDNSSASTAPKESTPATPSITQAKPIKNISGVLGIEMTLKIKPNTTGGTIDYNRFINFIDQLSLNRRSVQITNVTIAPKLKSAELTTLIFVKP